MAMPQIIIPDPRQDEDREKQLKAYFQQREERLNGIWRPVNVRFQHDPEWKEYWLSMCAARERRGVWLYVSWLFYAAQASFWAGICFSSIRR